MSGDASVLPHTTVVLPSRWLVCVTALTAGALPLAWFSLPACPPAASHSDRYELRCSAGHRIFYHQPCWRKASGGGRGLAGPAGCVGVGWDQSRSTGLAQHMCLASQQGLPCQACPTPCSAVRMVDGEGAEQVVVGKDFKWSLYKKVWVCCVAFQGAWELHLWGLPCCRLCPSACGGSAVPPRCWSVLLLMTPCTSCCPYGPVLPCSTAERPQEVHPARLWRYPGVHRGTQQVSHTQHRGGGQGGWVDACSLPFCQSLTDPTIP
jgi:hypothetical protein